MVVDAASGANMTYPPEVRLGLAPNPAAAAPVVEAPAPNPILRPASHERLRGPGM